MTLKLGEFGILMVATVSLDKINFFFLRECPCCVDTRIVHGMKFNNIAQLKLDLDV